MQATFLPLASTILQVENRRRYLIEDFHADSAILIPLLLIHETNSYATRQSQTLDLERLPRTRRAAGRRQAAYQLRDRQARRRQRFATEPLETRSRVRFTRHRARRHV